MHIFLSYATEQKSVAEPIAFSLRSRGHHVFLDKDDLPPGRTFDDQIQKAVEQSDVMVYLVSPASVAKGRYTRTELEFARAAWRHPANRLLPVMIEHTPISDVPSFLTGVTILEPQGNVTAEVAAAVQRLRGPEIATASAAKGAAIVAASSAVIWAAAFIAQKIGFIAPEISWLSGLPFCAVLWFMQRRRGLLILAPLATLGVALFVIMNTVGTLKAFESIDSSSFYVAGDTETSDTTDGADSAATNEAANDRKAALDQISRMNQHVRLLNFILIVCVAGVIGLLGVFAGATWSVPEINSVGRWVGSAAFVGAATALIGFVSWVLLYKSGDFLADLPPLALTMFLWFPLAGSVLAYWIGRGRPA